MVLTFEFVDGILQTVIIQTKALEPFFLFGVFCFSIVCKIKFVLFNVSTLAAAEKGSV